jgi:chromosome segregation ATPase
MEQILHTAIPVKHNKFTKKTTIIMEKKKYSYDKKHIVVNGDTYDQVVKIAQTEHLTHNDAVIKLLSNSEVLAVVQQERNLLTEKVTELVTENNQLITQCNQADNQKITELQEEITELKNKITESNQVDNQKITELSTEITKLNTELSERNQELNEVKKRLSNEVTKPDLLQERIGELRFQYIRFSALVKNKRTGQTVTVWDIVDEILQEYYDGVVIGGSVDIPSRSQKQSINANLAKYE